MTSPAIQTRAPTDDDIRRIVDLLVQLGYGNTADELGDRVRRLVIDPRQFMRVAVDDEDEVVGVIHAVELEVLESGRRCELVGLVVDETVRGRGIGHELVMAAERWAAARGLPRASVRSNIVRADAHAFFERQGYVRVKTQHVYRKELP